MKNVAENRQREVRSSEKALEANFVCLSSCCIFLVRGVWRAGCLANGKLMEKGWQRTQGAPVLVVDRAGHRLLDEFLAVLPEPPVEILSRRNPWQLAEAVRQSVAEGNRFFACLGGDQAWFAVATGTAEWSGVLVGYAGGPASLPRSFGMSGGVSRYASVLAKGGEEQLDTVSVVSSGAAKVEAVNAVWWGFGRIAGLVAGKKGRWRQALRLAGLSPFRRSLDLSMGSVQRSFQASGLLIGNGEFVSDLDVAPRAHPGDGKLDLFVFEGPAWQVWRMLPRMPRGTWLPHPFVREYHPEQIELKGSGRLLVDGVDAGRLPALVAVRPGRLLFAVGAG